MRPVTFTIYPSKLANQGRLETLPWPEWVRRFSVHDVRGDPSDTDHVRRLDKWKDGPAVILGEVVGKRAKVNVRASHAIGLDLDAPVPHPDDAPAKTRREAADFERRVEKAFDALEPFEYVVWTTHKSGSAVVSGGLRLRVVLPFAEPIGPADYPDVWGALNRLIGGINDPQTKDASRLNFLPSTFDPSNAAAWHHPGRWIRADDLPEGDEDVQISFDAELESAPLRVAMVQVHAHVKEKEALKSIAKGEPFAAAGERHESILRTTMWLARKSKTLSRAVLQNLYSESLAKMLVIDPDAPGIEEVISAYEGAVEKLVRLGRERQREGNAQLQKEQAGDLGPYEEEDLRRIAKIQRCEVEDLDRRWILVRDNAHWFLGSDGAYHGPYSTQTDASIASRQILARSPVRLRTATKSGFVWRSIPDIATESGCVAEGVVSDLIEDVTYFDPKTQILHEAVRPLRPLVPEYDEQIDAWLRILAGGLYSKLIDWMSCVSDLSKLLCAIYFDGPRGCGKTLFATGIARLWTEGPPGSIELVLSDFNDEIARCPMILADEEIPKRWRSTVTTQLRSLLSTLQRTLIRKYRAPAEMRGAVRLILTANNEFLLDSKDVATQADIEAIAQRFLYIKATQDASDFMNALPRHTREAWATDGIARHALWLRQNHEIENPGARFWVEGDVSDMHLLLVGGAHWNSFALEWCIGYAMDPLPYDSQGTGLVRRGDGELHVNVQAIIDGWSVYISNEKIQPTTAKMAQALRAISDGPRIQRRYQGRRVRYYSVSVNMILAWSDRLGKGDRRTILENLGDPSAKELDDDEAEEQEAIEDFGTVPSVNDEGVPF